MRIFIDSTTPTIDAMQAVHLAERLRNEGCIVQIVDSGTSTTTDGGRFDPVNEFFEIMTRHCVRTIVDGIVRDIQIGIIKLEADRDRRIGIRPDRSVVAAKCAQVVGRGRIACPLPRGKLRRWKSLKERRAAWGAMA